MSEAGPMFYAWCDEADRVDALAAALSALVIPGDLIRVAMDNDIWIKTHSIDEVVATVRAHFSGWINADLSFGVMLRHPERAICFGIACFAEEYERRHASGPLVMRVCDKSDFLRPELDLVLSRGPRSIETEAALAWLVIEDDLEDLLLRFYAPDASGRIPTGACTNAWDWVAPVDMCATYNANAAELARDLALSWVHLHDKGKIERAAGMSLDALRARVDAAPAGARVAMKGGSEHARSLSRDTVLKALAAPPSALLDALEASAVPDDAWRAAAPRAREIFELTDQIEEIKGLPTCRVDTTTRKHVRFLEEHAPFRVRRLPSGGVVLATHPYRSLWPLWADALFMLGLMS
ncbi:hypothetical protein predicted by Glimmer/Critica [Sorangium cellulosum So ce56]|uniref:Uncharacterized protein n=1 Tax=Sorangium cellulosum (strain So ce56) TaxID=448385 RepID=A9GE76_SORC5|nr:hypothetical protein [Sorangium cellulosum]CAN99453.1 hypothetical protein predicted by Glimmer/Critica [Sorangium cellulosum So ce56]